MGQKVNPIAVRLNFNRFSDSSWFSDYYYSTLIYQDLNFRQYLHLLRKPNTNKLGFRSAKCIIHHFPKRSLVHLFSLTTAGSFSGTRKKTNQLQQSLRASFEKARVIVTADSPSSPQRRPTSVSKCQPPNVGLVESAVLSADVLLLKDSRPPAIVSGSASLRSAEWLADARLLASADEGAEPVGPNVVRPRVQFRQRSSSNSLGPSDSEATKWQTFGAGERRPGNYWLKSSILQKKRALVNQHRLQSADESSPGRPLPPQTRGQVISPNVAGGAGGATFGAGVPSPGGAATTGASASFVGPAAEVLFLTAERLRPTKEAEVPQFCGAPPPGGLTKNGCGLPSWTPPKRAQAPAPARSYYLTEADRREWLQRRPTDREAGHPLGVHPEGGPSGSLTLAPSSAEVLFLTGADEGGGQQSEHLAGFVPPLSSSPRLARRGWFRKDRARRRGEERLRGATLGAEPLAAAEVLFLTGAAGPSGNGSIKHAEPTTSGKLMVSPLWSWFGRGTGYSAGRPPIANCQNVRPLWDVHLAAAAESGGIVNDPVPPVAPVNKWSLPHYVRPSVSEPHFNFYAIHYFFMQKMGDSLGRLPPRLRSSSNSLGRLPSVGPYFLPERSCTQQPPRSKIRPRLPTVGPTGASLSPGKIKGRRLSSPLTYRPNSIWPTIRVRHFSPNRTSRVLCLDRRSRPVNGFSLDTHVGAGEPGTASMPQVPAEALYKNVRQQQLRRDDRQAAIFFPTKVTADARSKARFARSFVGHEVADDFLFDRVELSASQRTRRGSARLARAAPLANARSSLKSVGKESRTTLRRETITVPERNEWSSFFGSVGSNQITKSLDFYLSNVHYILSQNTNTFISMRPIKVHSVFQCASLVAQEVACKLEQKKSFRLICRLIFQQLTVCNYIKGIRITCSGRLNGAEIAKTECRKFGETSLHVFSDKIDYARTKASTPYGILGVKVWISYI